MFTGLVAEEDEVNNTGIQLPSRSKVHLYIPTGYLKTMAVIHTECHFVEIGIAIVLCYGSPRMTEGIEAVVVLLVCHTHIHANFTDTDIDIGIETVGTAIALVEGEKKFVLFF